MYNVLLWGFLLTIVAMLFSPGIVALRMSLSTVSETLKALKWKQSNEISVVVLHLQLPKVRKELWYSCKMPDIFVGY